jgi:hypothetical protein
VDLAWPRFSCPLVYARHVARRTYPRGDNVEDVAELGADHWHHVVEGSRAIRLGVSGFSGCDHGCAVALRPLVAGPVLVLATAGTGGLPQVVGVSDDRRTVGEPDLEARPATHDVEGVDDRGRSSVGA